MNESNATSLKTQIFPNLQLGRSPEAGLHAKSRLFRKREQLSSNRTHTHTHNTSQKLVRVHPCREIHNPIVAEKIDPTLEVGRVSLHFNLRYRYPPLTSGLYRHRHRHRHRHRANKHSNHPQQITTIDKFKKTII